MSVQKLAVAKAVAFLKASGAQYKIVLEDELVADTFPPPAEPAAKLVRRPKQYDFVKEFDYLNRIKALQPGQEVAWPKDPAQFPNNAKWHNFTSAVASGAKRTFGEDNYIVHLLTDVSVTVLRVA